VSRVYVGIGSNVEPVRHVTSAVRGLRARFGPLLVSPVYASDPVGFNGPQFLNLVVGFDCSEPPEAVAAALDELERTHGRTADSRRFAPRGLDLDFLLYGDRIINSLRLPRDDIRRYAFVLRPLAELAPDGRDPRSGERFADMWARFQAGAQPLLPVELPLP
jgi:2-amino-4-hydroxy-6-hydroxymethyldihydropteridine diphosphokinase